MIRKAILDDLYHIEALELGVFGHSLGKEYLYFEISENPFSYYLVYELNKQIIGYIGLNIVDKYASINNFVVAKEYQRNKIGQQLLNYVLVNLKELKVESISLEVRVSNLGAIAFYEKNDFKKSHIKPLYYGNEDGIFYVKEVK